MSPPEATACRPMARKLETCKNGVATSNPKSENKTVQPAPNTTGIKKKKTKTRPRLEAVLIKPAKGSSYTEILKNLNINVQSDTLDVKSKGLRPPRSSDVRIEFGDAA